MNPKVKQVYELLPATAVEMAAKLKVSRVTINTRLRILRQLNLAVMGDPIVIPHGFTYIHYKTTPDGKPEVNPQRCKMPLTTLTHWQGGNPYMRAMQ